MRTFLAHIHRETQTIMRVATVVSPSSRTAHANISDDAHLCTGVNMSGLISKISDDKSVTQATHITRDYDAREPKKTGSRIVDVWRVVQSVPKTRPLDFFISRALSGQINWKQPTANGNTHSGPCLKARGGFGLFVCATLTMAPWEKNPNSETKGSRSPLSWEFRDDIKCIKCRAGAFQHRRHHTGSCSLCVGWQGELQGVSATFH